MVQSWRHWKVSFLCQTKTTKNVSHLNAWNSVMQTDRNSFCGNVVLNSISITSRDEDTFLDAAWLYLKVIQDSETRNSENRVLVLLLFSYNVIKKIIITIIKSEHICFYLYIRPEMLPSSLYSIRSLSKTTAPARLFPSKWILL